MITGGTEDVLAELENTPSPYGLQEQGDDADINLRKKQREDLPQSLQQEGFNALKEILDFLDTEDLQPSGGRRGDGSSDSDFDLFAVHGGRRPSQAFDAAAGGSTSSRSAAPQPKRQVTRRGAFG